MKQAAIYVLRVVGGNMLGITPLLLFLDYQMGIVLSRDYVDFTIVGFILCVIFFGIIWSKVVDR